MDEPREMVEARATLRKAAWLQAATVGSVPVGVVLTVISGFVFGPMGPPTVGLLAMLAAIGGFVALQRLSKDVAAARRLVDGWSPHLLTTSVRTDDERVLAIRDVLKRLGSSDDPGVRDLVQRVPGEIDSLRVQIGRIEQALGDHRTMGREDERLELRLADLRERLDGLIGSLLELDARLLLGDGAAERIAEQIADLRARVDAQAELVEVAG